MKCKVSKGILYKSGHVIYIYINSILKRRIISSIRAIILNFVCMKAEHKCRICFISTINNFTYSKTQTEIPYNTTF